jgi:cob(I)alamin adenosyltransferase
MAKRLTRIVTRTGDDGTTGLASGSRVAKDALRMDAIGDVDELNSTLGALLAEDIPEELHAQLTAVQHDLFDLGGELSLPGHAIINEAHVERLERDLEALNERLPPLAEFVLPGGTRAAAAAHVARAVCRRAERSLVTLSRDEPLSPLILQYVNRLSDLLFVAARTLNAQGSVHDVLWQQGLNRGE